MSILNPIWDKVKNIPTQPCCGYFLHGGTRIVGLLDFVKLVFLSIKLSHNFDLAHNLLIYFKCVYVFQGLTLFSLVLIGSEMYQSYGRLNKLYEDLEYLKYYCKYLYNIFL